MQRSDDCFVVDIQVIEGDRGTQILVSSLVSFFSYQMPQRIPVKCSFSNVKIKLYIPYNINLKKNIAWALKFTAFTRHIVFFLFVPCQSQSNLNDENWVNLCLTVREKKSFTYFIQSITSIKNKTF